MELKYKCNCAICGIVYNNISNMLMHVSAAHKIDSKTYYEKTKRKKGEGFCKNCGKETDYKSYAVGYETFCSTKCSNAYQQKTAEHTVIQCQECFEKIEGNSKNAASCAFSRHIKNAHKMTAKDYYDKYVKKEGEGICAICGKPTNFIKMTIGYNVHCSHACAVKSNQQHKLEIHKEFKQFKEEEAERIVTDEMIQDAWQKECARRLAEFEAPERCTFNRTDFAIAGAFGTVTEWG